MFNILQGQGKADLLRDKVILPIIEKFKDGITVEEYIDTFTLFYKDNGVFQNEEHREIYSNTKSIKDMIPKEVLEQKVYFYEQMYEIISKNYLSIYKEAGAELKRHLIYIPYGIFFEERIKTFYTTYEQTTGDLDYWGKVDFVNHEKKEFLTVKATRWLNVDKLKKQILERLDNNPFYKDYSVKLIYCNPRKNFEYKEEVIIEKLGGKLW